MAACRRQGYLPPLAEGRTAQHILVLDLATGAVTRSSTTMGNQIPRARYGWQGFRHLCISRWL
jgi:hypothetical protein